MLWLSILYSTSSFGPNPFFTYLIFCILGGPLRFIISYITLKFARRKGIILCSTLTCILLILSQGLRLYGESDLRWIDLEVSLDTEKKYEKLILVLGILCKMFSDYYWDYAYCFTVESMPTVIRQRRDFQRY